MPARGVAGVPGLGGWLEADLVTASRAGYLRASIMPYFHPIGTCRMGSDGAAVVDPQLRVRTNYWAPQL